MKTDSLKAGFPKLYNSWRGMRDRCHRRTRSDAHCYSEKGISICAEWSNFSVFANWALANGYVSGLTIERKKSELGYCPENCKWADRKEQARNIARNRIIDFAGKSLCLSEWAEATGIPATNIVARIDRLGWSIAKSLTTPTGAIPTGPKPRGIATC